MKPGPALPTTTLKFSSRADVPEELSGPKATSGPDGRRGWAPPERPVVASIRLVYAASAWRRYTAWSRTYVAG